MSMLMGTAPVLWEMVTTPKVLKPPVLTSTFLMTTSMAPVAPVCQPMTP